MADIDDELLALAGGDSDDEGSGNESRGISASPPPAKRGGSKKGSGKKSGRGGDDSEEEGEAYSGPGTPNSLESAPMDESDSDAEPSRNRAAAADDDDDDKYPVEGMYVSQAERAEIMAMREVEREQIIAERMMEIERQRQNRLLRQMISSVENEERTQGKKKRNADTAELEGGEGKASRQRTGDKGESQGDSHRTTAMDSLRRARAEKARRREDHERRKDTYSPRDRDSGREDSDDDFDHRRSPTPEANEPRDQPPAELRDYDRVRLGRNEFAQVCFTPGFEQAITGCYIRIALGPHPETGIEQYRMALIKGFTTGRAYALNGPNGTFVTDQYVKAAHGKAIKEFPFIAASSGKFTDAELNRYKVTCHNEGVTLPAKAYILDKIDEINKVINHSWTSEEIKGRLKRIKDLKRRFDPAERERVARILEEARERGDDAKVEELQDELDKLGTQRLAFRTSLGPSKLSEIPKGQSEQDRLAERNRENRRLNAEAVRKAQLKEKAKSREIEMAIKRGEAYKGDMSRRLRTKAKFVYDVNESADKKTAANGSGASTPGTSTPKPAAKSQLLPHLAKLQEEKYQEKKGIPTIHKPLMDDDVIGSLDLDIDVEI
ncbi:RNA polymerase-associated protein rtf1 [Fusarium piperis]|uniref:RNA polymerase-associated protein rtf1 n=1 Tax=Fusarium piperis TaxID=1435070 RepID=A0A9W8W2Q3_9HYPO|nr:RNA polymerase-associated protein rtf1 [Fusarium piperis]